MTSRSEHGGGLAGLSRVYALAAEMDAIVRRTVADVKADGATWEEIGQAVGGISKQAAHRRYGHRKEVASDA
jgi:hypothetical protein